MIGKLDKPLEPGTTRRPTGTSAATSTAFAVRDARSFQASDAGARLRRFIGGGSSGALRRGGYTVCCFSKADFDGFSGGSTLNRTVPSRRMFAAISTTLVVLIAVVCPAQDQGEAATAEKKYRGLLGENSKKVKREGNKTYLWAAGNPSSPDAKWYDFTGSPIPPAELQFGIGKDRIKSIDDPLFVKPDDPRLLELRPSPYRRAEKPQTNDDIRVIGYAVGDDVRAYPVALLDLHEVVNDRIGNKPLAVGW